MTSDRWNIKPLEPTFASWKPSQEWSKQIVVLVSGDVDSSIAAHLLEERGCDVLGITMKIHGV